MAGLKAEDALNMAKNFAKRVANGITSVTVNNVDKTITFTINTDKTILSDALLELNLITGHDSTYGLYIDSVNGISHDFNTDGIYWAIYEGNDYAQTGIDGITITNGATYKLIASK